ncbi:retrovirus-related pol polyprotein from transposon TNT 1-94 [Tanacetum coccineum]
MKDHFRWGLLETHLLKEQKVPSNLVSNELESIRIFYLKTRIGAAGYVGAQNRVGNANPGQARQIKCYNGNGIGHIARNCTQPKRP